MENGGYNGITIYHVIALSLNRSNVDISAYCKNYRFDKAIENKISEASRDIIWNNVKLSEIPEL